MIPQHQALLDSFAQAPFHLDASALDWVTDRFTSLDQDGKIGQTLLVLARDLSDAALDVLLAKRVGGVHRMPSRARAELRASADYLQRGTTIPMLLSADLEFSEKGSFADGTALTNQMGVAATGDEEAVVRMATIAAREGRWSGFNWSFTPVVDIDFNPRSSVVNTRAFSSDPKVVARLAALYIQTLQAEGLAAAPKHFPGDGRDERDQHFLTTVNDLDAEAWQQSYGKVFEQVIAAGSKTIMVGHIALPSRQSVPGRAATVDPDLIGLLRRELGFKGLVISDAAGMGGFLSQGPRSVVMPACIQAGCDILLFPERLDEDFAHIRNGLRTGHLDEFRLDEAVLRVLALKASLGLHRPVALPKPDEAQLAVHRSWAQDIAERSITLVRDNQQLLPLDPMRTKRVLLLQEPERLSPSGPLPPLEIEAMLRGKGFDVTIHRPGSEPQTADFDVAIYVVADEGLSGKQGIRINWSGIQGSFPLSMWRAWHDMPALLVSLGSPHHLFDVPDCPTLINAYSAVPSTQQAVVAALLGELW